MTYDELEVGLVYHCDPVIYTVIFKKKNNMIWIADLKNGYGWQPWLWQRKEWKGTPFEEQSGVIGTFEEYFDSNHEIIEILFEKDFAK